MPHRLLRSRSLPWTGGPRSFVRPAARARVETLERRSLLSTVVFADGFEGTTLTGWTPKTYSGDRTTAGWGTTPDKSYAGARSAYVAGPGRGAYYDNQHDAARRTGVSLAGYGTAALSFKYYLNTEAGYDIFSVNVVSADGSKKTVFQDSGDETDKRWQSKTISLDAYAGKQGLSIELRFDSDASFVPEAPSGVWVDDLRLTADTHASTGTIRGSVYEDADGDRVRDAAEGPLSGWVVYLDQNQNRRRDNGEAYRTTDSAGRYTFSGLAPRTYYVAQEVRAGFAQTSPRPVDVVGAGAFNITVNYGGAEFTSARRTAFAAAVKRWTNVIVGDLPDVTEDGTRIDDVAVDAAVTDVDGPGGVLAQASPSAFRDGPGTRRGLPYRGFLEIDKADLALLERNGRFQDVVTHELAHVLGFGTFWEENDLVDGGGSDVPQFVGPVAVAQYNALFNRTARYIPLEDGGGPGTHDSHWREGTLGNELMTGFINNSANPLSRITVGSMADLGYTVNLAASEPFTPPGADAAQAAGAAAYVVAVGAGRTRSGIDFGNRRNNRAPTIGSLSAAPSPAAVGSTVILRANSVADADGTVASVTFYRETNGVAGLQTGTGGDTRLGADSNGAGGYSLSFSTAGLAAGTRTYYAQVADNAGALGGAASTAHTTVRAAATGGVSGTVFRDADGDGTRDAGETALGGWKVFLDANNNALFDASERSAVTDAAGAYAFTSLAAGEHRVRMVVPTGWGQSAPASAHVVTLAAGASVTGKSFGGAPLTTVTGRVFNDLDRNGARATTEAGLAGWRVYVDANRNGLFDAGERSALTAPGGTYSLAGLRPGTYTVRLLNQSGWRYTVPSTGAYTVTAFDGKTKSANNFGVVRAG